VFYIINAETDEGFETGRQNNFHLQDHDEYLRKRILCHIYGLCVIYGFHGGNADSYRYPCTVTKRYCNYREGLYHIKNLIKM